MRMSGGAEEEDMDAAEDVCRVYPDVLVYSMHVEWLGLDGQAYVNSSVRVEWSESESRAVCEAPRKLPEPQFSQEADLATHCGRCLVQVLAFASLFVLLLRGLRVHSTRPCAAPAAAPSLPPQLRAPPPPPVFPAPRRSLSAAAILEKRFHKPFVTAR